MKFLGLFLVFMIAVTGCAQKKEVMKTSSIEEIKTYNSISVEYSYKIRPGDRISILFYRHPELSTRDISRPDIQDRGILVSKDGTITLPLIGKLHVDGLTEDELEDILKEKYSRYIKKPDIYIEIVNKRIYVIGEVKNPGMIPVYRDKIPLIEAISRAGDITDFGKRDAVYILKGGLKNPKILRLDLSRTDRLLLSNLYLNPEDIVYIPPNKTKRMNLAINGALPLINLIGGILSSFVDIKYLSQ